MITTLITEAPICATALADSLKSDTAGAIVTFSGDVRNNYGDRTVLSLTYEIHPSAKVALEDIVNRISLMHNILGVSAAHRYGDIPIGESAFVVVVTAKHRGPAFAACQEIVEAVKEELPIWKHQVFDDGTDEWVNSA